MHISIIDFGVLQVRIESSPDEWPAAAERIEKERKAHDAKHTAKVRPS